MIRYALVCEAGHTFESWFRASADYDRQRAKRLIDCPRCGSTKIEKQIMAPAVSPSRRKETEASRRSGQAAPVAMLSAEEREFRAKLRELREYITKNSDYVGDRFPELARQMHYEEIERRSIYGEAKTDEVRSLLEEGIEVHPLPPLPEDRN